MTDLKFNLSNYSEEDISCNSQNLIYLLSCKNSDFQYVDETSIPLHSEEDP